MPEPVGKESPEAAPGEQESQDVIRFGGHGHEREYVGQMEGFGLDHYIPDIVCEEIARRLGESWVVSNRGTRIEIAGGGQADPHVESIFREVIGEFRLFSDEYAYEDWLERGSSQA